MRSKGRLLALLAFVATAVAVAALGLRPPPPPEPHAGPPVPGGVVRSVSPRLVSNATVRPLLVFGEAFEPDVRLLVEGLDTPLEPHHIDSRTLTVLLPAGISIPADRTFRRLRVGVVGDTGGSSGYIDVVNDLDYPVPYALEVSEGDDHIFVASPTTDEVFALNRQGGIVHRIAVGDGPHALARWGFKLVVGHRHEAILRVIDMDTPEAPQQTRHIPGPAERVVVVGHTAWITSSVTDRVYGMDLTTGATHQSQAVGINPRALAATEDLVVVGNRSSADVTVWPTGERPFRVAPDAHTKIDGSVPPRVMGGTYPRALAIDRRRVFVASMGPNLGPADEGAAPPMRGGVGVIDVAKRRFVHHVSIGGGLPQALAYDSSRKILYAADIGRGRIVALSTRAEVPKVLASVALPPPNPGALARSSGDLPPKAGAGDAMRPGPWDLRLIDGGQAALVLERFTGRVTELDLTDATQGRLGVVRSLAATDLGDQPARRLGEALFFSDHAGAGASCDRCHPDGQGGGVLVSPHDPGHIYRAPSLRSVRETAPYYLAARYPTLEDAAAGALGRSGGHLPAPTPPQTQALGLYLSALTTPPSPWRSRTTGRLPPSLTLPGGRSGNPKVGLEIFEGKGRCSGCHPTPEYSTDQDPTTRGRTYDVGTPATLGPGVRGDRHDELPAPSLMGLWDRWPLLRSGLAGVQVDGDALRPAHPFALRRVFELDSAGRHGQWAHLSDAERRDLMAFLLVL